jgi:hypothetical protein
MRVRLLDCDVEGIADRILSGELPPETGNKEVIQEIARRVADENLDVEFYRWDDRGLDSGWGFFEIAYDREQVKTFADRSHLPEPRPIGSRQPEDTDIDDLHVLVAERDGKFIGRVCHGDVVLGAMGCSDRRDIPYIVRELLAFQGRLGWNSLQVERARRDPARSKSPIGRIWHRDEID